jgi:hypothetical protein
MCGSYKSSSESFSYSLKDFTGIGPVKMPIKVNQRVHAVYHNPNFGPVFGRDLLIATNVNFNASASNSAIGCTYQPPANCDKRFLTGLSYLTVSEYEVFHV